MCTILLPLHVNPIRVNKYINIKNLEEDGKGETNTIIMGDWNSAVADKSYRNIVGPQGLGRRNQSFHIHVEFCDKNKLYILLTVHLEAIVDNNQLDALFLICLFHASTCFEQQVLIIRRTKLY